MFVQLACFTNWFHMHRNSLTPLIIGGGNMRAVGALTPQTFMEALLPYKAKL